MSTGIRTLAVLLALAVGIGCSRPPTAFSVANARAHVNRLAGSIGARPVGTDANRRAREYLVEQLRFYGFSVRVQDADAARPEYGLTARVQNIIAILPGSVPDAMAVVAHYDSVPIAPGAGDDASAVAVALEVGRLLAARTAPRHSVMVLLTDAEENGLMGAAALVTDPEVKARLRVYVNVDSVGAAPPVMLFQTGPGNAWLVRAFAAAAPAPRGSSLAYEVYSRLPNDTDFTVLQRLGVPGLNFGAIGDSYAYHTPRDAADRLDDEVLEDAGGNVLATMLALDGRNLSTRTAEQAVYFDILSSRAFAFSPLGGQLLGIVAIVLGLAGWIRTARVGWRGAGLGGTLRTAAWVAAGAIAVSASVVGAAALLRAVREVYHPWYAHPGRFWLVLVLTGLAAAHVMVTIGGRVPDAWRAIRHPAMAWSLGLPAWLVLAVAVQQLAPGAAFLWTLPVGVAGLVTLLLATATGRLARLAAAVVLVVTAAIWLPDARALMGFAIPLFGRLPLVTPVAALPAVLLLVSLMFAVPIFAMWTARPARADVSALRRRATALVSPGLGLALTVSFAWAYVAEPYTRERPLWRYAQYVADHTSGQAMWEVAGNEPGLDLHVGSGAPAGWRSASGPLLPGTPVAGSPFPFAFRTAGSPGPPPVTAVGTMTRAGDEIQVQVRVRVATAGATVLFTLPPGLTPTRSSLPGQLRGGAWTAAYIAPPPGQVVFTASFYRSDETRVPALRAGLRTTALPGGTGAAGQPGWLPVERATWDTRAVELVAVAWVADDPALR